MSRGPIRNVSQWAWRLGQTMDAIRTGPPPWLDDELRHFEDTRDEYQRCRARWLRVPGGRALHAVFDDDTAAVCGLAPDRWQARVDGYTAMWLGHHRLCQQRAGAVEAERLSALFRRQREEVEDVG